MFGSISESRIMQSTILMFSHNGIHKLKRGNNVNIVMKSEDCLNTVLQDDGEEDVGESGGPDREREDSYEVKKTPRRRRKGSLDIKMEEDYT